jgi:hypothetical protein
MFAALDSGSGFVSDLRQASAARSAYRASVVRSVACATLVTASRHDRGVAFAHADDLVRTIPDARLVEIGAPSHLFWLGPARQAVSEAIRDFLSEQPWGRSRAGMGSTAHGDEGRHGACWTSWIAS